MKLTEKRCLAILISLFMLCSAFILSFGHSFDNPTVPDERAYYMWSRLFIDGYISIPLEDWVGMSPQPPSSRIAVSVNETGIHFISIRADVLDMDNTGEENDLLAVVRWEDGSPVFGAQVVVRLGPGIPPLSSLTNYSGEAVILNIPPGIRFVDASIYVRNPSADQGIFLRTSDLINVGREGKPYLTRLSVDSYENLSLTVRARDSFNASIKDVKVTMEKPTPTGSVVLQTQMTDSDGRSTFMVESNGIFLFIGNKTPLGQGNFLPSVVQLDGDYYCVNRWPPGYQILLAPFVFLKIHEYTTIILMAVASISCYLFARKLFRWRVAFLSTIFLMTCALALIMVFEVGMADYASMTFAILGIALFFHGLLWKGGWPGRFTLFLGSGLSMAWAVWIRYSTATLILVPLGYLLFLVFEESRKETRRYVPTRRSVLRGLGRLLPFISGLLILGLPLALYNATFFGSPFSTGYNFGSISVVGEGENITGEITKGEFYENFNPAAALQTIHIRLSLLFLLVPFAYIMPLVLWKKRMPASYFLVSAFLANFLLYLFVPWVASWTDDLTRSIEDMRYFLPGVPFAAICSGLFLAEAWECWGWKRIAACLISIALVVSGFALASLGIGMQLERLKRSPSPLPPFHNPVTIQQLFDNAFLYNQSLVEVDNIRFDTWLNTSVFMIRDPNGFRLKVVLDEYNPGPLTHGDMLTIKGMFRWFDMNSDGNAQFQEMSIIVKGGTKDSVDKH